MVLIVDILTIKYDIIKLTGKPLRGNPVLNLERGIKMIGVYKITNKVNGKMYIGGSINMESRRIDHFKPSRINRFKHLPLYEAMIKFGRENFEFEILEEVTKEKLDNREEYYIDKYNTVDDGYNVVRTAYNLHDEEFSKAHSARLRERNLKNWQDPEYREHMTNSSREYQKTVPYEKRLNAIKGLDKYTDSIKKKVYQYDKQGNFIAEFNGTREAERQTGVNASSISAVALGKRKTAGGFVWKYPQKKSVETIESN